jgi:formylglycine-generating enzyme required for sulfatase activity
VYRRRTTEVESFAANPWGLDDMNGNVWEWVEDVWHNNYKGAPTDGTAWTEGEESSRSRVLRGGSWDDSPRVLRSAARSWSDYYLSNYYLGFRIARTLE